MNKIRCGALAVLLGCMLFSLSGCEPERTKTADFSNAQEVASLVTFECTYHNVVRIERDPDWPFFDWGRKQEWFEYNVVVSFGIDASKVAISAPNKNGEVTISIPKGQVLKDPKISPESMSDPVDDNGPMTEVTDEERKKALSKAQQETLGRAAWRCPNCICRPRQRKNVARGICQECRQNHRRRLQGELDRCGVASS